MSYVEDVAHTGRPKKCTLEVEKAVLDVISQIQPLESSLLRKLLIVFLLLYKAVFQLEASTAFSENKVISHVNQPESQALIRQISSNN